MLKNGQEVLIICGKDKGKKGEIIEILKKKNKFKVGDNVKIIESRPYSKKKKWKVLDK